MALSFLAMTLLLLGYPDQSDAAIQQALTRARGLRLAFTTSWALSHAALLGVLGWKPRNAAAHAEEAIAHSVEHGLVGHERRARFFHGALLAQNDDPHRGVALMGDSLSVTKSTARNRRTLFLGQLASAHARLGRPEVAFDMLEEAIQTAEATHERFFEAELCRLQGMVLMHIGQARRSRRPPAAGADHRPAAERALVGAARGDEPRAAVASRRQTGRSLLAPRAGLPWVYGRF